MADKNLSEPESQHLLALVALAVASFAAGLLLGYELGRSRSTAAYGTPDQPIPPVLCTSESAPKEGGAAQQLSSLSMPSVEQAIRLASEKDEMRMHARAAAAAIEQSSEADPKLFASASGMRHTEQSLQAEQARQADVDRTRESTLQAQQSETGKAGEVLQLGSTDGGVAADADSSHPVSHSAVIGHSMGSRPSGDGPVESPSHDGTGGPATDVWEPSTGVPGSTAVLHSVSEPGQEATAQTSAASVKLSAGAEAVEESRSARNYNASSSGELMANIDRAPDMLQSMEWVASSAKGKDGRSQPEHWDRATAFWAAFTGKLDVRCPMTPCMTSGSAPTHWPSHNDTFSGLGCRWPLSEQGLLNSRSMAHTD